MELDATIQWAKLLDTPASNGDCSSPSVVWHIGQPADNAVIKCIKVTDIAIPKHGRARIDVSYEFRWKGTDGWASTAATAFHAGFAFKSATSITFDGPGKFALTSLAGQTVIGNQVVGLVGAGEKITGIGGFVFDQNASAVPNAHIKLFNSPTGASCGATPVAQDTTSADGFYFIWDLGTTQASTANDLPSNVQYYVMACDLPLPTVNWPSRSMDHKLGSKEFDEEDFYVSPSTKLVFIQQPSNTRVNNPIGTIKVAVEDAFGNIVTKDQSTTITLQIGNNPAGGMLSGTGVSGGQVTVPVVNGVATFTGLKINHTGNGYTFTATSNPFYTGGVSGSFNITN
jgi:hypothetical protein